MFSAILSFVSGIFEPAAKLIDKVTTTEQERLELRNELAKIQTDMYAKLVDLESKRLEMETKVRTAEAGSQYWLTANWRPAVSIILVATILYAAFADKTLPTGVTELAEIFLGVHAGGRSVEKIAKNLKIGS